MIRLFAATHRATCLDGPYITPAEIQAYAVGINNYFAWLFQRAEQAGLVLAVVDGDAPHPYETDESAEQDFMQHATPFFEWYRLETAPDNAPDLQHCAHCGQALSSANVRGAMEDIGGGVFFTRVRFCCPGHTEEHGCPPYGAADRERGAYWYFT